MTDRDTITLPREVVEKARKALTPMAYHTPPYERDEIVAILRTHLAAEPTKVSVTLNPDAMRTVSSGDAVLAASSVAVTVSSALAAEQPKPEPVAWQCREHGDDEWFDCSKEAYGINPSRYVYRCLYTAPPDAEALRRDAEKWRKAQAKYIAWQKGGKAEAMEGT